VLRRECHYACEELHGWKLYILFHPGALFGLAALLINFTPAFRKVGSPVRILVGTPGGIFAELNSDEKTLRFGGMMPLFLFILICFSTEIRSIAIIQYLHPSPVAEVPLHLHMHCQ
jgi:hypothetical protein